MKKELGLCTSLLRLWRRASSSLGGWRRSMSWARTCRWAVRGIRGEIRTHWGTRKHRAGPQRPERGRFEVASHHSEGGQLRLRAGVPASVVLLKQIKCMKIPPGFAGPLPKRAGKPLHGGQPSMGSSRRSLTIFASIHLTRTRSLKEGRARGPAEAEEGPGEGGGREGGGWGDPQGLPS